MTDRMDLPETGADFAREPAHESPQEQPESRHDEGGQGRPDPAAPSAQPDGGQPSQQEMVPHARFHAVNEELRGFRDRYGALESRSGEMERRLAEVQQHNSQLLGYIQQGQRAPQQPVPQQPPAPPPDWFADPDGAARHAFQQALSPYEKQLQERDQAYGQQQQAAFNNHVALSRELAAQRYGDEVTNQAEAWLDSTIQANPAMRPVLQQMIFGPGKLPGVEMVKLYQGQAPLGRPQGLDAQVEAEVTRRLAALGHAAPAPQQAASGQPLASPAQHPSAPPAMPSSFATARNGGPRSAPQASGPRSLNDIMGR